MQWALSGNIRRLKRKSLIGQAILLLLGVELLFFAAFTCLQLPVATQHNLERYSILSAERLLIYLPAHWQHEVCARYPVLATDPGAIRYGAYVPIVPVAIFLGYILGVPLGLMATFAYITLGLVGPHVGVLPLASGGGVDYWRQPTCGYLAGLVGASWFAGRITQKAVSSLRQIAAVVGSLLIIHGAGLLYLFGASLGLFLFQSDGGYVKWQPWLFESARNLSWYPLPYDVLFSLGLIGIGFPVRWLVATLTAPDIGMGKSRPKWDQDLADEENVAEPVSSMI